MSAMTKPRIVSTIEVRMGSSRLPGKTMKLIQGKPTLEILLERLARAKRVDQIVVATSVNPEDDAIESLCKRLGYSCYRGSLDNVTLRVAEAAREANADIIAEITGDCILTCAEVVDEAIDYFLSHEIDYLSNLMEQTYPQGVDIRVFRAKDLMANAKIVTAANDIPGQDHVYLYFEEHPEKYRIYQMKAPPEYHRPEWRLDLDYQEDLDLLRIVFDSLYPANPGFTLRDLVAWLDANPQYITVNQGMHRKPLR